MRAREFIVEFGNRPAKYHWEKFLGSDRAAFVVGEQSYVFDAFKMNPGDFKIRFCQLKPDGDCLHGITNTGNEIEVFSTVNAIMQDFIRRVNPKVIRFSAEEASRQKLYDRMVRMLAKDWEATRDGEFYTLIRKQ